MPHASEQVRGKFQVEDLWDDAYAQGLQDELDLLVYRSNLLGQDRRVCNWKGGNTSSKFTVTTSMAGPGG